MKKFLITIFILLALAGTGFMFGWVQFSVPPGKYGVIHSKTHGIDDQLVRSGEFRWVWFKLIPTNVKIAVFSLEHCNFPIKFNSTLPSGDTYASFAGLTNANFTWDLQGEVIFSINPEKLIILTEQNNLSGQEDLDAYLQTIAQEIELLILREFSSVEADSERLEHFMSGNPDSKIEQEIRNRFPEILNFSFVIHSAKFPDFILYRQLRFLYDEFLAKQREFISTSFGQRAQSHIENQLRFEELERYGDLLTRFPILLDYLTLEMNNQ